MPGGDAPGSPNQVQVPYSRTSIPRKLSSGWFMKASITMDLRPASSRSFQNGGLAHHSGRVRRAVWSPARVWYAWYMP